MGDEPHGQTWLYRRTGGEPFPHYRGMVSRLRMDLAILALMIGAQAAVFQQHCAVCHDNPATRAPSRAALHAMSPNVIVETLTSGIMKSQGAALTQDQRVTLAEYLTGTKVGAQAPMPGHCETTPPFSLSGPSFNGWGADIENWRYQPKPGIRVDQLRRLRVKWAFGFPGASAVFGQLAIAGGRVFVGSQNGHVYSLDAQTGCYYWDFKANASVRTAITIARVDGRDVALFGDQRAHVYSVDVISGQKIWEVSGDDSQRVQITGSPVLFEGRLYVPIAVGDDAAAADPRYECCQGRGSIVALDATTGKQIWKTYTLPEATRQGKNAIGTQLWGPSGASIWSAPTIDGKQRVLYAATGDNHSAPASDTSDAVLALSLDSGKIVWSRQLTSGDVGNASCFMPEKTNCPEPHGPDADFGSSPNLIPLANGKRVLTIGQKSGMLWAIDPDDRGRIVWKVRVGKGGLLGGIEWGTATDGKAVYAAISDMTFIKPEVDKPLVFDQDAGGGLKALAVANGAELWDAAPARACEGHKNCSPAQPGAVTATPEYVLSGSVDGHVRAYSTHDGKVLWDYDTERPFKTVNGVTAHGGSLNAAGPAIAGGMLFVNSGYGMYGEQEGNVLIAFAPAD